MLKLLILQSLMALAHVSLPDNTFHHIPPFGQLQAQAELISYTPWSGL